MSFKTPILLLIFNRPELTKIVFAKIKEIKPAYLFVAADGPRDINENEICEQTRRIALNNIDWECKVETLLRNRNLGCKYAVSEAIDWFFSKTNMGIILEDDCLPDISFFPYCEELLDIYKDDERVMHICGSNFTMGFTNDLPESYYFSKYAEMWGWASWKRAWSSYDVEMKSYNKFKSENQINDIFKNYKIQKFWNSVFNNHIKNNVDTWDYQWIYSVLKNNGLCIVPKYNLVSNIGCIGGATHLSDNKYRVANQKVNSIKDIIHPISFLPNAKFDLIHLKNRFLHKMGISYLLKVFLVKNVKRILNKRLYNAIHKRLKN